MSRTPDSTCRNSRINPHWDPVEHPDLLDRYVPQLAAAADGDPKTVPHAVEA